MGVLHLEFCMLLADLQRQAGRKFFFEHPKTAISWHQNKVIAMVENPHTHIADFDMCAFGKTSKTNQGYFKKPTKVMTNSSHIHEQLHKRMCPRAHVHCIIQNTEGGQKRSTWAQIYPQKLCQAVARGIQRET